MKIILLSLFLLFSFYPNDITASENELSTFDNLLTQLEDIKVGYILNRYPKYHSELSEIRKKLLVIKSVKTEEEWMKHLSISSIEKLMYIYETENILFSLVPRIKDSEIQTFCDFVISHNQHDREELKHIRKVIQVTFDGIHQSEILHELDKAKRIISDSLELLDMTDEFVNEYMVKHNSK